MLEYETKINLLHLKNIIVYNCEKYFVNGKSENKKICIKNFIFKITVLSQTLADSIFP